MYSDTEGYNWLDLDNLEWYINGKSDGLEGRHFKIPQELADQLQPLGFYVLCKGNGTQYSDRSQTLGYHGWYLYDNMILRKSYETWNIGKSGRTMEEQEQWHNVLGHSRAVALSYYNDRK
jgi:hypothetical protein